METGEGRCRLHSSSATRHQHDLLCSDKLNALLQIRTIFKIDHSYMLILLRKSLPVKVLGAASGDGLGDNGGGGEGDRGDSATSTKLNLKNLTN